MNLQEILMTPQIIVAAAAIVAVLWGIGKIPIGKGTLALLPKWRKILPILPLAIGIGIAFAPGLNEIPTAQWGGKLVWGLWTGFIAAQGRKILMRLLVDKLKEAAGTAAELKKTGDGV